MNFIVKELKMIMPVFGLGPPIYILLAQTQSPSTARGQISAKLRLNCTTK